MVEVNGDFPKVDGSVWYAQDMNRAFYQAAYGGTCNVASVQVTTTATAVKAANSNRKFIILFNNGMDCYLGFNSSAGGTTGILFQSKTTKKMFAKDDIYATCSPAGTADIRYLEVE